MGGQEVHVDRPWMVYVEILPQGPDHKQRFHCGGAIINLRFILTAAHCACDALPCSVNHKTDELEVKYDPKGDY